MGVDKLLTPIVDANTLLLMYTKYSSLIFYKILTITIVVNKFVYPNNFFGPWGNNISIYNFADINNRVKKLNISENLEPIIAQIHSFQNTS